MNVTCEERDRIFADGTEAEWSALESHATTCAACREELRGWKFLSLAAAELRDHKESPGLWGRIQQALIEQEAAIQAKREDWSWRGLFTNISWQTAAATALVALLLLSAGWLLRPRRESLVQQGSLLKSKRLTEVEHAEAAYVQAIDKLAADAKPQLDKPGTALMANYREKIQVLDSAIDDLRVQTGQNPSNAHLRYELLAMYQEKQRTLEEILEEKR
jgi:hypothetical protein